MSGSKLIAVVGVGIVVVLGLVFVISNDDDETMSGKDVDGAFVSQMVPHHEGAIEMAEIAKENGERPEIIQLANEIVRTQSAEIEDLNGMHVRIFGGPVGSEDHGDMGMDETMMGMDMDMGELETAKPFDREFIDQMIVHHQGAIRMARMELRYGEDQEAKDLATAIVDAQAAEIEQMNSWRQEWYGAPSPSGGVPSLDEMDPMEDHDMGGMNH
jgi:uncharacterized protein (DUF305 family)